MKLIISPIWRIETGKIFAKILSIQKLVLTLHSENKNEFYSK
jgi:hypothetical protein